MDTSEAENNLELEVKDFGPILEARIDLRPLTVFIGPSNTGKSYLAILIYALHRFFSDGGSIKSRYYARQFSKFRTTTHKKISSKAIDDITEFVNSIFSDEKRELSTPSLIIPNSLMNIVRDELDEQGKYFWNELSRCFGIESVGRLVRQGRGNAASISFHQHNYNADTHVKNKLEFDIQRTHFSTTISDDSRIPFDVKSDDDIFYLFRRYSMEMLSSGHQNRLDSVYFAPRMLALLASYVRARTVGPFHLPAFYLPADRTGIMHAHNVVVSALIESAAMTGLRPAARTPMLSGVLADFLEQLIQLDKPAYGKRRRQPGIDTQIERSILAGSIKVDKSAAVGYPHFTYRPIGWKNSLPLTNASSMVSELAPVVLYLRHVIEPGNVLIVEEPESHLHPEMQVQFTRQLAGLVNAGIRVIVTTHSEWVLEELANIVRRSGLPTSDENVPQGARGALRPDQVGAWLFKRKGRPKGSTVEEITLDEETGLYPTDYDAVREELYNEGMSIFNRIKE